MASNFIKPGRVFSVTAAPYARLSGEGMLVGKLFGVCLNDVALGASVEMETEGVFKLKKTDSQAWTQGAAIYWDDTNKACTTTASGNTFIGHANVAYANTAGIVAGEVRLHGASI